MAKILFGPIATDARGKSGGTVFTRNAYGPSIKRHTSPGAANTKANAASKSALAATAKTWNTPAMDPYREGWNTLATTFTVPDRFNNQIHLSGIALFVRANKELKVLSGTLAPSSPYSPPPFLLQAPADQDSFDIGGLIATFTPEPPFSLSVTVTNLPTGEDQLVVCASNLTTVGRKLPKTNKIPTIQVYGPDQTNPFDFTDNWQAKFLTAPTRGLIAVAAYTIRASNGAAGLRYATLLSLS
jgi:hypothetical protein